MNIKKKGLVAFAESLVMSSRIKVAAVQAAPVAFDLQESLQRVSKFTSKAASSGADLVVFPYQPTISN